MGSGSALVEGSASVAVGVVTAGVGEDAVGLVAVGRPWGWTPRGTVELGAGEGAAVGVEVGAGAGVGVGAAVGVGRGALTTGLSASTGPGARGVGVGVPGGRLNTCAMAGASGSAAASASALALAKPVLPRSVCILPIIACAAPLARGGVNRE